MPDLSSRSTEGDSLTRMRTQPLSIPAAEIDRPVVLVLLAICALASLAGVLINGAARRPELVLAAVALPLLAVLLWRLPRSIRIAKQGLLIVGIAAVHGRVFYALYRGLVEGDLESKLPPLGPWLILLSGLSIVLSRDRGGTQLAVALWATTTAAVVAFLAWNRWPLPSRLRLELVNQFVLAHLAFLFVMIFWSRLRSELRTSRNEMAALSSLARTDALTEVGNRRAGQELLTRMVEHCVSRNAPLGVVLFDLDRFKAINDRHGHPAGDRVIQQAARVTEQVLRPWDYICRWGERSSWWWRKAPTSRWQSGWESGFERRSSGADSRLSSR